MKAHFVLLVFAAIFSSLAQGQGSTMRKNFSLDSSIQVQIDSLKEKLGNQGFTLVREAPMSMESGYEKPVIVPLNEGTWYQFVFIGEVSSRLYEVRMYDYDEKQVVYEKHFGEGVESNIISFRYIPKFSEYHIIRPVQLNKKKKEHITGYIMMFKKVS